MLEEESDYYRMMPLIKKENQRDKYLYDFGMKTPKLSKKGKKMFKQAMGERNPI